MYGWVCICVHLLYSMRKWTTQETMSLHKQPFPKIGSTGTTFSVPSSIFFEVQTLCKAPEFVDISKQVNVWKFSPGLETFPCQSKRAINDDLIILFVSSYYSPVSVRGKGRLSLYMLCNLAKKVSYNRCENDPVHSKDVPRRNFGCKNCIYALILSQNSWRIVFLWT